MGHAVGDDDDDDYDLNCLSSLKLFWFADDERRQQRVNFVRQEMRYQQNAQVRFLGSKGIEKYIRNHNRR